jgi:hypothetical protein
MLGELIVIPTDALRADDRFIHHHRGAVVLAVRHRVRDYGRRRGSIAIVQWLRTGRTEEMWIPAGREMQVWRPWRD